MNTFLAFTLTALIIELTPGPNMGYLVMTALTRGRSVALVQVAGIALGLSLAGLLSALGLSRLFEIWPPSYEIVRWVGIGYLLWLAYDAWRDAEKPGPSGEPDEATRSRFFLRGLNSNLLNPKAYLFYVSVIPGFFTEGAGMVWLGRFMALSLVLIALWMAISTHRG